MEAECQCNTTGNTIAAGYAGEVLPSTIATTQVTLTASGVVQNVLSLTLTAGTWQVYATGIALNNSTNPTTWTDDYNIGISTTNNAMTGTIVGFSEAFELPSITSTSKNAKALHVQRFFNVTTSTAIYLNHRGYYSGSNPSTRAAMWAVRIA